MLKKSIPHLFTSLNLICGCLGVYFAFQSSFKEVLIFVLLGVFFDFFDGFFARLFHVESELGVQLDSLADLITSGLVPGVIVHQLLVSTGASQITFFLFDLSFSFYPVASLGFLITLGAAFRLAKFNIQTEKISYFKGLPAPANALFFVSIPLLNEEPSLSFLSTFFNTTFGLILSIFLSILIMNIHWKMFSLKIKKGEKIQQLLPQILLLIGCVILFYFWRLTAIPLLILFYLVLNFFFYWIKPSTTE